MQAIERIVFFGTPTFALPALEALVASGRPLRLVVSKPARPSGRGERLLDPPVARRATEMGLEVDQPASVRDPSFLARLQALAPDLAVVVAFGQIFPRQLLELPRLGCLNLHASLLPRFRGAAPIAAAIAAGDSETGVSVQRMEQGLDTGAVYAQRSTPIGERENAGELADRLAKLGAALLLEVVESLERGQALSRAQEEQLATYAPKLDGSRVLDLSQTATELEREIRAFNPEPGAVLDLGGHPLKVLRAVSRTERTAAVPGTVIGVGDEGVSLAVGAGTVLELLRVQRPGARAISGRDLANGSRLRPGARLT